MGFMDASTSLVRSQPRRNVKKTGSIEYRNGDPVSIITYSCRRCGTYGRFTRTQPEGKAFEDYHNGKETQGTCPDEAEQTY
jgi:hypothetical protein